MTTILTPKFNYYINWPLCIVLAGLLTVICTGILLYNQIVNVQHAVANYNALIEQARLSNADLKNDLFHTLDSKRLLAVAQTSGLVAVLHPEFLKLDPAVATR